MTDQITFRMNGVCNAFMREFGCKDCPQCSSIKPRAHTSGSLIIDWGARQRHLLFDCGMGVIDSLIDFDAPFVTDIFLSHNHYDHIAGLDFLIHTQARSGGPETPPVYCTEGTRLEGPEGRFPWLDLDYRTTVVEKPIVLDSKISLRVTPIGVYHGLTAKEPVIWVVEFEDPKGQQSRKLILAWDLLHLIPRYSKENRDHSYSGPSTDSETLLTEHESLLKGADALFIEGNTLTSQPQTGHTSIQALLDFYVPQFEAEKNFIVHYSGHEDPGGPLSDADLQQWIDNHKHDFGFEETHIRLAKQGEVRTF